VKIQSKTPIRAAAAKKKAAGTKTERAAKNQQEETEDFDKEETRAKNPGGKKPRRAWESSRAAKEACV